MVATRHLALVRVATFAMLATRALKHTIYGNFGAYSPTGLEILAQIQHYAWQPTRRYALHPPDLATQPPALRVTVATIHTGIVCGSKYVPVGFPQVMGSSLNPSFDFSFSLYY
jgi:hypothetical protein